MKPIDFKTSGYFPWPVIFLGFILAFIGLGLLPTSIIIGIILLLVSVVIFTTHYRFSIDLDNKLYHDYLWFLGFKFGDKRKFETIAYIFIKKNTVSQKMYGRVASSTISTEVSDAYLKFSETDKIHLFTRSNKKALIQKIKPLASNLNLDILDYSEGPPVRI